MAKATKHIEDARKYRTVAEQIVGKLHRGESPFDVMEDCDYLAARYGALRDAIAEDIDKARRIAERTRKGDQ